MPRAKDDDTEFDPIDIISREDIQILADRLLSRGCSNFSILDARGKNDLITASRVLRALLRRYERQTGRELSSIMLSGGC